MLTKTENGEKKLAPATGERWLDFESMQRFFEDMWTPFLRPWTRLRPLTELVQMPALDMHKENSNLVIEAALPGMNKEEIKLTVTGQILTIEAVHKEEKKTEETDRYVSELHHGRIFRSLQLPLDVDATRVVAEHKDGMLKVTLPLSQPEGVKSLNVAVQ